MASNEIEFIKNVDKLHAFYTENVRMLAHAYDLEDEDAARILARFDFNNVSRSILRPPRVDLFGDVEGMAGRPDEG
ncbi:hypothetical protein SAMN05445756_0191 [Kytococcus aerolatus]|uniref:Uncharacterized protein n=1 Tax=Kytococcus aerolatus TaxID=592308 RepID=A0A212T1V3_9MICO|nr:hypothetical protein [Kytococcus aerolatus]SNC60033.1 hypothetical protein SAMN05445756_0191 [Kytococcus aerolatus]